MKTTVDERRQSVSAIEHSKLAPAMTSTTVSLVALLTYALIVVALHFLRPDLNLVSRSISEYAIGPYGILMTLAFFAFAAGVLSLASGIYWGLPSAARSPFGLILLVINAISVVIVGIFPTDLRGAPMTAAGGIHNLASLIAFPSLVLAFIMLSWRFKDDANWRFLFRKTWWLSFVVVGLFVQYFFTAASSNFSGLQQRFFLVGLLSWLLLVASQIRVRASQVLSVTE